MIEEHKVLFVEWCAADALGGMTQMKPMTELAYRRIIDMIYSTNDRLLDDDDVLQFSTKTGAKWKAIKKELIEVHGKIFIEAGRIRNTICTEKLEKSRKNIAQKSEAAKAKHAKDKALKNNDPPHAAAHAPADASAHANQEPKNPSKKEDAVDARARTVFELGEQIAELVGWKDDPNWFGDYSRLQVWLDTGHDFDLDILPTITRIMAKKTGPPPSTLKYFEKAIADAKAQRLKPMPEGDPRNAQPSRHANPALNAHADQSSAFLEAGRRLDLQRELYAGNAMEPPEIGNG